MKKIIFNLVICAFALGLRAQETNGTALSTTNDLAPLKIGAADATNYYDHEMIVTGKVAQVTIRPSVTFLNLDKKFPDSPFEVVIFHGHSSFYGNANALKGKSIEVRGRIIKYKDKPEMALDSTNQLTVIGVTNLSLFLNPVLPATNAPAISKPANFPASAPPTNVLPEIM